MADNSSSSSLPMYAIVLIAVLGVLVLGIIAYGLYVFNQKKRKTDNTVSTPKIIMVDEKIPSESNEASVRSDSIPGTPIVIYFLC